MSAAKKAKTEPVFPDIPCVEKPLLQALATVCAKLYDDNLYAEFKPKGGAAINDKLDQPCWAYKKGGEYTDDACPKSTKVISGYDIFNHDIKPTDTADGTASLAEYGEVIDGFTDFHGEFQPAFPPFAALIVQPKDEPKAVRAPVTQSHPHCPVDERMLRPFSFPTQLREGVCAVRLCVAGPHPHPRLARVYHGVRLDQRCRVLSHSL